MFLGAFPSGNVSECNDKIYIILCPLNCELEKYPCAISNDSYIYFQLHTSACMQKKPFIIRLPYSNQKLSENRGMCKIQQMEILRILKFIYTERKRILLSLSPLIVNIKLDSFWTHLEAGSLSLSRYYKRTLRCEAPAVFAGLSSYLWLLEISFDVYTLPQVGLYRNSSVNLKCLCDSCQHNAWLRTTMIHNYKLKMMSGSNQLINSVIRIWFCLLPILTEEWGKNFLLNAKYLLETRKLFRSAFLTLPPTYCRLAYPPPIHPKPPMQPAQSLNMGVWWMSIGMVASQWYDTECNPMFRVRWQVASSTLDASAKIYAGRVDAIHSETYKVLTGLGRGADKQEKGWFNSILFGAIVSNVWRLKLYSDLATLNAKAKIFFDVCRLFFDLFHFHSRFFLVWINP